MIDNSCKVRQILKHPDTVQDNANNNCFFGDKTEEKLAKHNNAKQKSKFLLSGLQWKSSSITHKHLGMILDTKLDFQEHLKDKLGNISKTIRLLRKLLKILTRRPLPSIYKLFIRPYLDYGEIIYDKAFNSLFNQNLEKIQDNSALAITGAIKETSKENQELRLESLEKTRWFNIFYKIFNKQSPTYFLNVIPVSSRSYLTRYVENVHSFKVIHDFFQNSFFAIECNKIDKNIRKLESLSIFKKSILKFIRPSQNRVYNCHNPKGIKLLTRLRIGIGRLR